MLTIYKASAGSGKTYTLAYEYIKLLLGVKHPGGDRYRLNTSKYLGGDSHSARHRHILAITFTNKATEEMKSRIIKELGILATNHSDGSKDTKYASSLMAEFGCTREELREVAEKSLRSLLFDYHHFNVSTIDSFFQTVLRAFAREVDRQGDYGIELNDEFAVTSGISMMLDDLNYGNPDNRKEIHEWIRNYTMELIESGKDSIFFNRSGKLIKDLASYVERMSSEHFKKEVDRVMDYLKDPARMRNFVSALDRRVSEIQSDIKNKIDEVVEAANRDGLTVDDLKSPFPSLIDKGLDYGYDSYKKLKSVPKWLDQDTVEAALLVKKADVRKVSADLLNKARELIRAWPTAYVEIHSIKKVREACPNLVFLGFTWNYIRRFREENNLILLSDTHDLLHRIIGGSETPFIYERIGVTLSHFLIDEFQDTSTLQWSNLKPLVADSISYGDDNLIIGDEKQAIYRFRNSDSSLLHHVVANEDFPSDHQIKGDNPTENTNHRSAHGIVRFNNALFTRVAPQLNVEGYENTIQELDWETDRTPPISSLSSYIQIYDTKDRTINDMPAQFEITAREILRQHEAGYRWKDIAILVRTSKEGQSIVDYLMKNHPEIKILSSEALLLKNSPAIKFIIGMLKLVDKSYTESGHLKAEVKADEPVYGTVGDIRMMISRYDYFRSENYEPAEALRLALQDSDGDVSGIRNSIVDVRSAHPSSLVALVETIIDKKLSGDRCAGEYAFIAAFQDAVIDYCTVYNPSIHAFLQWWEEKSEKLAINPGAGQDAVTVMTIHAAKGLEHDCVHIPFGDWKLFKPDESIWLKPDGFKFVSEDIRPPLISVTLDNTCLLDGSLFKDAANANRHEQIVDNLNITYVAYTRAKRELTICFPHQTATGKEVIDALAKPDTANNDLCMDLKAYILPDVGPDGLVFRYGEPTAPVIASSDKKKEDPEVMKTYPVYFRDDTSNLTTIEDATSDLGEIRSDDEVVASDDEIQLNLFEDSRSAAAMRGTHLHSIMADIETAGDIPAVVSRAAARYGLTPEEEQSYISILTEAFSGARRFVGRWFSPDAEIYKEQSIYRSERDETFRPDRIIINPDGSVEVVDYKFTAEPYPSHYRQVEVYISLLRDMGYDKVRGYLWYPELNIVKQVKSH